MFERIGDLYSDEIMTHVEDGGNETHEFKTDPRELAATIRKIMTQSSVKKQIAVGWKQTCLFPERVKEAIRNLVDENEVPEAIAASTSTQTGSRPRPQTPPQREVVNLISPEPSTDTGVGSSFTTGPTATNAR